MKDCNIYGKNAWKTLCNRISVVAHDSFRESKKFFSSDTACKRYLDVLKPLKEDKNIHITKPDKGRGVVILNKTDYVTKMLTILADSSKFMVLNVDVSKYILKLEDKLNRTLRDIKHIIGDLTYHSTFASGSKPGVLYGLPKIHKLGNPLRPIVSSIGTFSYNIAKFLVPILSPLTSNEFTIENSYKFVNDLCSLELPNEVVMASFDVESLFTNVPLSETSSLILDKLFNNDFNTRGLNRSQLEKLLELSTKDSVFIFDDKLYSQIDGVCMGGSLGPVYANAFLCHHEVNWLNDCPSQFRPRYYKRYVDDTFLLFDHQSHAQLFLNYLNSKHPNIKFTMEIENNNKLSFLDVLITRDSNKFYTSVYRKPTFTGLSTNYLSFSPSLFKINSVKTLINRAYNICSSYFSFDLEMKFLLNFFYRKWFPFFCILQGLK